MDETLILFALAFIAGSIAGIITSNRVWRRMYKRALADSYDLGYAAGYKRAVATVTSVIKKNQEDNNGNGH